MTLLAGINHAAIVTNDLDRWTAFYIEIFDAEIVFHESTPDFRHAILRIGEGVVLHPAELRDNPHGEGRPNMFARGHLDHLGLSVSSREAFLEVRRRLIAAGASDGQVSDLGPQWCLWFQDPDGMRAEVCWIRDYALQGYHAPQPVAVAS